MVKIDRESVLGLIQKKDWLELVKVLKDNEVFAGLCADELFMDVFNQVFLSELLNDTPGSDRFEDQFFNLAAFYNAHISESYQFALNKNNFKKLVLKLVDHRPDINYAKHFPDEEKCREIINEYDLNAARIIKETTDNFELKQKFNVAKSDKKIDNDYAISIFKSPQELQFYFAALRVFPEKILLPNAALSTVIDSKITDLFEVNIKGFFFSSTVDLVVIDENNYKPLYFFELDSSYHNAEGQIKKDEIKNEIINQAGFEIVRIRKRTGDEDDTDFEKLIRKLIGY